MSEEVSGTVSARHKRERINSGIQNNHFRKASNSGEMYFDNFDQSYKVLKLNKFSDKHQEDFDFSSLIRLIASVGESIKFLEKEKSVITIDIEKEEIQRDLNDLSYFYRYLCIELAKIKPKDENIEDFIHEIEFANKRYNFEVQTPPNLNVAEEESPKKHRDNYVQFLKLQEAKDESIRDVISLAGHLEETFQYLIEEKCNEKEEENRDIEELIYFYRKLCIKLVTIDPNNNEEIDQFIKENEIFEKLQDIEQNDIIKSSMKKISSKKPGKIQRLNEILKPKHNFSEDRKSLNFVDNHIAFSSSLKCVQGEKRYDESSEMAKTSQLSSENTFEGEINIPPIIETVSLETEDSDPLDSSEVVETDIGNCFDFTNYSLLAKKLRVSISYMEKEKEILEDRTEKINLQRDLDVLHKFLKGTLTQLISCGAKNPNKNVLDESLKVIGREYEINS